MLPKLSKEGSFASYQVPRNIEPLLTLLSGSIYLSKSRWHPRKRPLTNAHVKPSHTATHVQLAKRHFSGGWVIAVVGGTFQRIIIMRINLSIMII